MSKFKKPYLAILSGKEHDAIAGQVALSMAVDSVQNNPVKGFHWHSLTSLPKTPLLTDDGVLASVSSSGLLIISNIAVNSTMMKIEKLRDIIDSYSHIPRIVVVGGIDPLTFSKTILHKQPNYAIYFGKRGVGHEKEKS